MITLSLPVLAVLCAMAEPRAATTLRQQRALHRLADRRQPGSNPPPRARKPRPPANPPPARRALALANRVATALLDSYPGLGVCLALAATLFVLAINGELP